MNDLISVIVPIYKVEKYLDRCVESIVNQTYKNLEIILVDDGSTDNCPQMCDDWAKKDSRIKVVHKQNGGLSDARNAGIEIANGEHITFVDSDDWIDNDYVEYMYGILKKYGVKLSISQHRVRKNDNILCDYGSNGDIVQCQEIVLKRLLYSDVVDTSAWAKLYARELFADVRYPKGKLFEDMGTTYKLFLQCKKIAVGNEAKYNYCMTEDSIVHKRFSANKFDLIDMTDCAVDDIVKIYFSLSSAGLRRKVYARLSTLNQMMDVDAYFDERQEIIDYILLNGHSILKDPLAPERDKIAIYCLSVGYRFYKSAWKVYCWVKK